MDTATSVINGGRRSSNMDNLNDLVEEMHKQGRVLIIHRGKAQAVFSLINALVSLPLIVPIECIGVN